MKDLQGKVAIVTGGSRGIGKTITKELLHQGAKVVICSRKIEDIKQAISELDPKQSQLQGIPADVSSATDCNTLIRFAIKTFDRVDILVNNAGIYGPIGEFETLSVDKWEEAIRVNLFGTMHCSHAVIPHFKKQLRGKIINIAGAGVGGKRPLARFSAYYTSKTAVVSFTEVLASELLERNIQVNCISPGAVKTKLTEDVIKNGPDKAGQEMYNNAVKQMEDGGDSPETAAKLIAFLASEQSNHITGKMLSAKWDPVSRLKKQADMSASLYTLRRIDDELFYEK